MGADYSQTLVLLDAGATWEGPEPGLLAYWAAMETPPGTESIPLLVEHDAGPRRQEYLAWVHELGEYSLDGRSVREHLRLNGKSSYWWLTLIAEKSPMKSPGIYEVLKLRALEHLYLSRGCRGLVLCSANGVLHQVLSAWCRSLGHAYDWRRRPQARGRSLWEWLRVAPQPVRAAGYLVQFWWQRLRRVKTCKEIPSGGCQATVVTYFPNIDRELAQQGVFESRYWGRLHQVLEQGPWRLNWIWIFAPSKQYSFAEALELRRRFAEKGGGQARYFFWEEFLSRGGLIRVVGLYLRLCRRRFNLRAIRRAFHFPHSKLDFWPVLARDWSNSLSGWVAMENCLYQVAFEAVADKLPRQEWGLYAWENHAWERALNVAWKRAGHRRLIGFQHVSLRYLDLRSFEDPRLYALGAEAPPPPDLLAVGGRKDQELLEQAGFPGNSLVPVEALRYLNLVQLKAAPKPSVPDRQPTLLVVTGYLASETTGQLRLLAQAAQQGGLQAFARIIIKPHPYCPVEPILQNLPELKAEVINEPLGRLWPQATVVYTANSTSASLEAACLGLPTLVHIPENSLNLSPLLGKAAIPHVGTTAELIQGLAAGEAVTLELSDFFTLDLELPRWRRLLAEGGTCQEGERRGSMGPMSATGAVRR